MYLLLTENDKWSFHYMYHGMNGRRLKNKLHAFKAVTKQWISSNHAFMSKNIWLSEWLLFKRRTSNSTLVDTEKCKNVALFLQYQNSRFYWVWTASFYAIF